jgi:hypothetical protein
MSDAAVAATPSNFDAHLATVDMSGPSDQGMDSMDDSTGPSNDNNLRPQIERSTKAPAVEREEASLDPEDPEQRVDEDGQPYEFDGEQEQPDQEDEQEQEAPEGMPSYEDLQELYQVTSGPELHEYFLDKTVPTPVNGTMVPKTVRELQQGYLRMSDYSRGKQELAQHVKQAQAVIQQNRDLISRMADPKVLRAALKRLGPAHEKAFHEAAYQYAAEFTAERKMTPEQRARVEAERKAAEYEERLREYEAQRMREQEAQREQPRAQLASQIENHLTQNLPALWAQHGVHESPIAMQEFSAHLRAIWDGRPETVDEALERATIATAETLGDRVQQHQQHVQQRQPQRQQQPLPPRRLPSGGPARPGNSAPQRGEKGYRSTEFTDYLSNLGRR